MSEQKPTIESILADTGVYVCATWGVSMRPMLRQHRDTVIIVPPTGRLKKYDVPLYRRGKDYVLHRVVRPIPGGYLIRGDNCTSLERVREEQVIGVLESFYRNGKSVAVTDRGYRAYARVWAALFPIRWVRIQSWRLISRIWQHIRRMTSH